MSPNGFVRSIARVEPRYQPPRPDLFSQAMSGADNVNSTPAAVEMVHPFSFRARVRFGFRREREAGERGSCRRLLDCRRAV